MNGPRLEPAALLKHVRVSSDQFPHRDAGEPDEIGAIAYIADRMRALGPTVEVLEVPVMGWAALTQAQSATERAS
jgi:hypothetical protein